MIRLVSLIAPCLFLAGTIALAETPAKAEDLSATIGYLLSYVAQSGCTFIRNDQAHTAQEAAAHMQGKYDHFKDEINSPEDFIRLAASRSLMSGKPYMVKTPAGKLMKSETWLLEALEAYRKKQKAAQ